VKVQESDASPDLCVLVVHHARTLGKFACFAAFNLLVPPSQIKAHPIGDQSITQLKSDHVLKKPETRVVQSCAYKSLELVWNATQAGFSREVCLAE